MSSRRAVWLSAALASLASACAGGGDATIDLVFDPCAAHVAVADDAQPEEIASVEAAMAEWSALGGLGLRRADASADEAVTIRFEPTVPALHGVYDDVEGAILINRVIRDARSREIVIMHELGHAFGLSHVPADVEASLMNPGNTTVPPSSGDVTRLQALWGPCDPASSSD